MVPPRVTKLRALRKILASFGIYGSRRKTVGHQRKKHIIFERPDGTKFPIPDQGDNADVERTYVNGIRRAFKLTPQSGVSHADFYGRG